MNHKKTILFLLLLSYHSLHPMQLIYDHPKISMSVILFTGISFFLKNRLIYFFKKKFFLYQSKNNDVNKAAPTLTHPIMDPNAQEDSYPGDTLLHKACDANDIEEVRFLLLHPHTDPNVRNRRNQTALWVACNDSKLEIIELLLADDRTDPNIDRPLFVSLFRCTTKPDYLENSLKIIKLFIKNPKIDLNQKYCQYTLLSIACLHGWTEIVKMALEREDIDPNETPNPDTYLRIAHRNGNKEIFELLRNHPKADLADLFTIAVEAGYEDIVEELLNKYTLDTLKFPDSKSCNNPLTEALPKAARTGNINIFTNILKQKNININLRNHNTALYEAVDAGHIEIVKLLLQQEKIDINLGNGNKTPFYLAIKKNNTEIAFLLYNHDPATVNIQNMLGQSSLMFAASTHGTDVINFLIDICNANMYLKDKNGATFLHYLVRTNQHFNLNTLHFFHNYTDKEKKLFLNEQLESFAQVVFSDNVCEEIDSMSLSFINYCARHGADLNHRNIKGKIPLDIAFNQYKNIVPYIHDESKQFIIKEKIYHSFLRRTESATNRDLWFHLSHNGINKDIYRNIMKYYYALNIDSYVVNWSEYSCSYPKSRKIAIKKNRLKEQYERLGIFDTDARKIMHSLTL